jgi:acyl-CoA synthetase (AMP-forming)/AMP-acid ligase II
VVDEPDPPGGGLGRVTYTQFGDMARSLAAALDDFGVAESDRVAIVSPNAARFLISLFGVSVFGRILVPVNFRLNAEEVRYIVEHSGSSVLLVDPEFDELLRHIPVKHRFVLGTDTDPQLFLRKGVKPRLGVTDENATVSINYTSGTTARPKGVQLTHRNFWLNAVTFGWHLAMTDRDVYLHTLPTFHCNGWGMPYAVTAMGVRQIIIRKIDGEEILRRIEAEGVTLLNCAPAVIAAVLEAAARRREHGVPVPGRGRVRAVIAGAPPPTKTIERIETELGWEFIQIYGLTETSPLLTVNRAPAEWDGLDATERARRLSRAGVPAVGVRMRVDKEGEVLARSNHVFEGYWNQPEETAKAIVDGWFHTGDGGHVEGAYIAITDRRKDVIITGGENVSSIEVEDCLFQHPAVAEVAVIGVPDEKWGETIKALVVLHPAASATERELIEHCRSRMAHYKCPTSIELRDALVRTATGKLQKFKLREPYWAGCARRVS